MTLFPTHPHQSHFHIHHHNYEHPSTPPVVVSSLLTHDDCHHQHHSVPNGKRKHRLVSTASACVAVTGIMAWCSVWKVSKQLLDPRKLLSDPQQGSTNDFQHQPSLGNVILLRPPELNILHEITLDQVPSKMEATVVPSSADSTLWHRVVYLGQDNRESWEQRGSFTDPYSITTYPRVLPLTKISTKEGSNKDDDDDEFNNMESGLMQDYTRWYPQIDSSDEAFHMELKQWPIHEMEDSSQQSTNYCHPMHAWQSTSFPVCNTIHENNIRLSFVEEDLFVISKKGFWRNAWGSVESISASNFSSARKTVWKTFKYV